MFATAYSACALIICRSNVYASLPVQHVNEFTFARTTSLFFYNFKIMALTSAGTFRSSYAPFSFSKTVRACAQPALSPLYVACSAYQPFGERALSFLQLQNVVFYFQKPDYYMCNVPLFVCAQCHVCCIQQPPTSGNSLLHASLVVLRRRSSHRCASVLNRAVGTPLWFWLSKTNNLNIEYFFSRLKYF